VAGIDALVALQADQAAAKDGCDRLGGLGLADARRTFEQQGLPSRKARNVAVLKPSSATYRASRNAAESASGPSSSNPASLLLASSAA